METKTKQQGMFLLGVAICFAVAGLSVFVERLIPGELLGASIIALFMGTFINSFFHPTWIKPAIVRKPATGCLRTLEKVIF